MPIGFLLSPFVLEQYVESGVSSLCFFPSWSFALRCFETLTGSMSLFNFWNF